MRRVARVHTMPELLVRRALHRLGFRYQLHVKELPGSPDIVLPSARTAVFVHGCFWHRHTGCRAATTPKTRQAFWEEKFQANVERDARKAKALAEAGWAVKVVWECEAKSGTFIEPLTAFLRARRASARSDGFQS